MEERNWIEDGSPEQPFLQFRSGYVIELEKDRYFSSIKKGRIYGKPLLDARYFPTIEKAEEYVHRHLGFAGMRVHICRTCWTLVETETLEQTWVFFQERDGRPVKFAAYQEAKKYQCEERLQKNSMVEFYAFREKEILLAA